MDKNMTPNEHKCCSVPVKPLLANVFSSACCTAPWWPKMNAGLSIFVPCFMIKLKYMFIYSTSQKFGNIQENGKVCATF